MQEAVSSNLTARTICYGLVAQLVSARSSYLQGRRFKSDRAHHFAVTTGPWRSAGSDHLSDRGSSNRRDQEDGDHADEENLRDDPRADALAETSGGRSLLASRRNLFRGQHRLCGFRSERDIGRVRHFSPLLYGHNLWRWNRLTERPDQRNQVYERRLKLGSNPSVSTSSSGMSRPGRARLATPLRASSTLAVPSTSG